MQHKNEENFDVEKILGRRLRNGRVSFYIQFSTCRKSKHIYFQRINLFIFHHSRTSIVLNGLIFLLLVILGCQFKKWIARNWFRNLKIHASRWSLVRKPHMHYIQIAYDKRMQYIMKFIHSLFQKVLVLVPMEWITRSHWNSKITFSLCGQTNWCEIGQCIWSIIWKTSWFLHHSVQLVMLLKSIQSTLLVHQQKSWASDSFLLNAI